MALEATLGGAKPASKRAPSSRGKHLACPTCPRSFARTEHLERHLRCHTKEKPFPCDTCGRRYSRPDVLIRHRRNAHGGQQQPAAHTLHSVAPRDSANGSSSPPHPLRPAASSDLIALATPHASVCETLRQPFSLAGSGTTALADQGGPGGEQAVVRDASPFAFDSGPAVSTAAMQHEQPLGAAFFDPDHYLPAWDVDDLVFADLFEPAPNLSLETADLICATALDCSDGQVASTIQMAWFTRALSEPLPPQDQASDGASRMPSPRPSSSKMDDRRRMRLCKHLSIQATDPPVPSTRFLNKCIRLYFSTVHPLLPVVHPATFRPSKANTALTIALCAMGSVVMGSQQALEVGVGLFQRLQKATLLYWEKAKADHSGEVLSMIQSTVIGQQFCLVSGYSDLLLTADAFQGPPVAWARQHGLFRAQKAVKMQPELGDGNLEELWLAWAQREERIRTGHALSILDAELAALLHHTPLLRLDCRQLSLASSQRFFSASSAREWREVHAAEAENSPQTDLERPNTSSILRIKFSMVPIDSAFTAYAMLEELSMRAQEVRADDNEPASVASDLRKQLVAFHQRFLSSPVTAEAASQCLCALWHAIHLSIYTDLNALEKAIGRDGGEVAAEEIPGLLSWASSEHGQKAALHALAIKTLIESMTLADEPAIHVSRALFHAGIVLYCYARYCPQPTMSKTAIDVSDFPGSQVAGRNMAAIVPSISELVPDELVFGSTLQTIVQLLKRVGSGGLTQRFAELLSAIIVNEYDST